MFSRDTVSHNGYLMQTGIRPMEKNFEEQRVEATNKIYDPIIPDICFEYLDKMQRLCEENGATLVLIKSPTNSSTYWWYDEWDEQISEYAVENGLDYYNFIEDENIGIDWSTDTYDRGLHLNVYGAEKFTEYFGQIITEKYSLSDERENKDLSAYWEDKIDSYYNEKKCKENDEK